MVVVEKKVNVLILESSKVIAARLVDIIMDLEEIDEVLYAPTFDKPVNLLLSDRVDIVLCSIALNDENVAKLIELRAVCKPFSFIVLFNNTQHDYIKKYADLPVDYFLNTGKELEKLPEIILQTTLALDKTFEDAYDKPKINIL
ncbi:MAG: hypothetical protein JWQ09_3820 [Segetibacter sp.]|nr:hypothetical protein [Segetibacter sp.]